VEPSTYTVNFQSNYGSNKTLYTKTVTAPATTIGAADFPADPARSGYAFAGWNTAPGGTGSVFTASTPVSADTTVYAQWNTVTPDSYTITFKRNDGTETVLTTKTVTAPATAIDAADFPADPERSGYAFAGWNTRADGSGSVFAASTPVSADSTVYAQWHAVTPDSHIVTFKRNDGTETVLTTKTVTAAATAIGAADFPADPERTGYAFAGWNTAPDGSGTAFIATTTVNANRTVYAQWIGNTYTIRFMINDGTSALHDTRTVTVPATSVAPADFPANPSRSGYAFTGWNTAPGGSGTAFTTSTTVNADRTVHAQWTEIPPGSHAVTFKLNDTTETNWAVKTVAAPATAIGASDFPANPARSGYTFASWNTKADGSGSGFAASTVVSADMTVYAQWTGNTYTVSFMTNDGTAALYAAATVTVPATIIAPADFPANPARSGYAFAGWNTASNGLGAAFAASTTINANKTIYAQWTGNTYTVNYKSNYGANETLYAATVTVPATTVASLPANPARTGYAFTGWNTEAGGSGTAFTAATTVNANRTVYAQWTGNTYTVNFMLNDGTSARHDTRTVTVPATVIASLPDDPVRSGYTFAGWNTGADGTGTAFDVSATINADRTVYAQWRTTYTVSFMHNDGTGTRYDTRTVIVPATVIASLPGDPLRNGYAFGGWNTAPDGTGTVFIASAAISGDIPVYAQWIAVPAGFHAVTFKRNNGTEAIWAVKTAVTGTAVSTGEFPADPALTGYNFGGWNTQADGSGTGFDASTVVNGAITVYAQWTAYSYTVNFDKNGGDMEAIPLTKTVASPAIHIDTLPAPPTRTGYNLGGWNTAPDGSGTAFDASTTVNGGITVYAQWTSYSYTVNFHKNGGDTEAAPTTKTVASPAIHIDTLPTQPTRSEYTFAGWNTAPGGTGTTFDASTTVNGAMTVYAQWTGNIYTVSFKGNYGTNDTLYTGTVQVPATSLGGLPADPARSGYAFAGWNTAPGGTGTAFTASTPVNGDLTVYAQWTGALITLNPDLGDGTFSQTDFTLSKGAGESQTLTVTGAGYANPRWYVGGDLKGTGDSIAINAADYRAGGYTLSLIISKNGVSWSREIDFTVTN
jgi:uncharacterized repeat protein (TIGR02543 family)